MDRVAGHMGTRMRNESELLPGSPQIMMGLGHSQECNIYDQCMPDTALTHLIFTKTLSGRAIIIPTFLTRECRFKKIAITCPRSLCYKVLKLGLQAT